MLLLRAALMFGLAAAVIIPPSSAHCRDRQHAAAVEILTGGEYFPKVKRCIDAATTSIKVMMFEASYYPRYAGTPTNQLVQGLIDARARGVAVEVILERGKDRTDRTTKANLETGRLLSQAGVDVYLDPEDVTTHTKAVIIDGALVVMGSANWTYSAMNKNHEASVVIHSAGAAASMEAYFNTVKKKGIHFKSFH